MRIDRTKQPHERTSQGARYNDTSFYRTSAWRSLRARKLKQSPHCESEKHKGQKVLAFVVDHIQPITLGGQALEITNLQSLCEHCHAVKSAQEKNAKYSKP